MVPPVCVRVHKSYSGHRGAIKANRLLEVAATCSNVSVLNVSGTSVAVADVQKAKSSVEKLPKTLSAKAARQSLEDQEDAPEPLPEEPEPQPELQSKGPILTFHD